MINEPFYILRILFWPLWPYPQAFESVVFMTQNWWYLRKSNVALFSYCCFSSVFCISQEILRPQLCYSVPDESPTIALNCCSCKLFTTSLQKYILINNNGSHRILSENPTKYFHLGRHDVTLEIHL